MSPNPAGERVSRFERVKLEIRKLEQVHDDFFTFMIAVENAIDREGQKPQGRERAQLIGWAQGYWTRGVEA